MGRYVVATYIGHDASLAIVGEGRICHLELERFTRVKHDGGLVKHLYSIALQQLGIADDEVVAAVSLSGSFGAGPTSDGWSDQNQFYEGKTIDLGREMRLFFVPHHTAHCAYAFYSSPFKQARFVTMDGGGDAFRLPFFSQHFPTDCVVGDAWQPFGSDQRTFDAWYHPPTGIGGLWIQASDVLFGAKYAEGKVMALAGISRDMGFGPAGSLANVKAMQAYTTRVLSEAVPRYPLGTPVCLGGGVALNGIAAYALLKESDVPSVWVPPAVHDGGLPIGGAMYVLHNILGIPREQYSVDTLSFCGYTDSELDGDPPIDAIVEALAEGKIVALAHGKAESGPRALGHRSLLANPLTSGIKDRLNQMKGREPWRPVAPVCLREDAVGMFNLVDPDCYHFMTMIAEATADTRRDYPAAVHDDGSARVQVVDRSHILGRILDKLTPATGSRLLLNTSFNGPAESMVNDGAQARDTASRLRPDVLVVGETIERL